ncbi:hypothetical protein [Corynebacterium pacaense]|uniref:hypothetical protein n=1 Tax=Corynebacterium pacaense TaxID=1816684 RepID=UPI0009BAFD3F|nr:hypothetical protein [Corynebacterium pacaense]
MPIPSRIAVLPSPSVTATSPVLAYAATRMERREWPVEMICSATPLFSAPRCMDVCSRMPMTDASMHIHAPPSHAVN